MFFVHCSIRKCKLWTIIVQSNNRTQQQTIGINLQDALSITTPNTSLCITRKNDATLHHEVLHPDPVGDWSAGRSIHTSKFVPTNIFYDWSYTNVRVCYSNPTTNMPIGQCCVLYIWIKCFLEMDYDNVTETVGAMSIRFSWYNSLISD